MASSNLSRPESEVGSSTENPGDFVHINRSISTLTSEHNPFDTGANTPIQDLSRRHSSSSLRNNGPSPTQLSRHLSAPILKRSSSYTPIVPSPLNPSSSSSSSQSSVGGNHPESSENVSPRDSQSSGEGHQGRGTGSDSVASRGKRSTVGLSPAQQILRQKSALVLRSSLLPPDSPRTLKDLGRDYSRYPMSSSPSGLVSSTSRPSFTNLTTATSEASLLRTTTRNPYSNSQADLEKWGYPDDSIGAFDPYYGGEKGFILYSDEVEDDDRFHMPADDDDATFRTKWSDFFGRRQIVSTIGGIVLILGILCLFVALPALSYTTHYLTPGGNGALEPDNFGPAWARVNNLTYPAMQNVRRSLIDKETPVGAYTRKSTFDSSTLNLVFSDEFNEPGRTFYPGDDPYWTGADIWYGATQDFEWYDPDAITTGNGTLQLRLDSFPNHGLQYRSGMLNSWNQMCFKGGIMEVSISLAGPAGVPGLWPGVWTMGNLGRPGFKASTEGVWPYTYNGCDAGITPNQSDPSGLSGLPGQKLNSCTCQGEEHPNPGTGRGAPELDVLEASVDPNNRIGVVTQSLQVAPFDNLWRPNSDFMALPDYNTTQMNGYTGGPFQQAVSATTLLNNEWYDELAYQKYAFEYVPGAAPTGKIAWFVGDKPSFIMDGHAVGPNGNIGARQVPMEPMSMILNLGYSGSWTYIDSANLKFPTVMHIDYVRIYQKSGQESVTCDPPGYPTTQYIEDHPIAYKNPNITAWNETGYGWPKNKLTGC